MNPPIITLSPVCTKERALMLPSCDPDGGAQYLPPVFKKVLPPTPPQTIISLPVQIAVWPSRAEGALLVLVAVQLSVCGLYLPPVFKKVLPPTPPQTTISLPVHTAV